MPIPAGGSSTLYVELETVKSALGKLTTDDRDDLITASISAACRRIDAHTGRRFYLDDNATARTYPVVGRTFYDGVQYQLLVDDIGTPGALVVETGSSAAWTTTTEYDTTPDNAVALGRPITALRSTYGWGSLSVRVTAQWGWPEVPPEVAQAALLLTTRLYRRKDSPQGVVGSADWGAVRVSRVDPDVEALLAHLMLPGFA